MAKTNLERQRDFQRKKRQEGYRSITRWVPADMVERLDRYLDKLTKEKESRD